MLRNGARAGVLIAALLSPALCGAGPQVQSTGTRFQPAPCPFRGDPSATYHVDCGTVVVPENRALPQGRKVRLYVAILRASGRHPQPDPVVFLDGGPGLRSLDVLPLRMRVNLSVERLHESRDVIFWDQRGTGYSEPRLCTSLDVAWFRNAELGYSLDEERKRNLRELVSCAKDLAIAGGDVSQLSTATSAADLQDIREALGITRWNLLGTSYGTRLALVYLRQSSGSVRAALLDGVYPPDVPETFAQATRMARVVELLGQRCSEDVRCNARFPRIAQRTLGVIESAARAPFSVRIAPVPGLPVRHLVVNDRLLAQGLYQAFYETELLPYLPALVEQIEKRNGATFEALAQSLVSTLSYVRQSMDVAVECHDVPALTAVDIERDNAAAPRLAAAFAGDANWAAYCDRWQPGRATAAERALPTVDTPTLMLSGAFDPVTPPSFARHAAASLLNARLLELPSAGHGGKASFQCVVEAESAFIDHPERPLDGSCAAGLPRVPFVTDTLVLPGLTRLLVGIQSGSHLLLLAGVAVAVFLQLICVVLGAASLVRKPREALSSPGTMRQFSWLALAAGVAALAATIMLALQIAHAVDTNPNVLLLGLAGPQHVLTTLTLAAGLLAVTILLVALRWQAALRRFFLTWIAVAAAVSCIATSFVMVSG